MAKYIIRRLLWLVPTILVMSLITFLVMHATPGSPLEPRGENNALDAARQENLKIKYGLDQPLYVQYVRFVWNASHGDFGNSYIYTTRSVSEIISSAWPVSLHLGVMAFVFALVGGIGLGLIAALHQNRPADYLATGLAVLAISLPNFIIAVFLILIFSLWLKLLPTGGWDSSVQWILPSLTLSLGPLAIIARYTRSAVLEVIGQDYIRTARAKGLTFNRVLMAHILKNALGAVVTVAGPILASIATGSFIIEAMFSVPGLGKYFVESMLGRDYPMIMGVVLLYGTFLAVINLAVDILYAVLNPRIRYA